MALPFIDTRSTGSYIFSVNVDVPTAARAALTSDARQPLYLRLADALEPQAGPGPADFPSARALALEIGLARATVTAAYQELARRGLIRLRPGRPRRLRLSESVEAPAAGPLDLARYAPDRELLPPGRVFQWLGLGDDEGVGIAQYGSAWGLAGLRAWIAERLVASGLRIGAADVLLTAGVQHGIDLVLRACARRGDRILVEDPTYPGLPPLLELHGLQPVSLRVGARGLDLPRALEVIRARRPALAILTPTLHNPSGHVLSAETRNLLVAAFQKVGTLVIEEWFDPDLVFAGPPPPPMATSAPGIVLVGSFSKALFPGLRVGWVTAEAGLLARVMAVKRSADLSGSSFLEAAALTLCQRGVLAGQLARLRDRACQRAGLVMAELAASGRRLSWSEPRGGFSLLVELPAGTSARAVAARAAAEGVTILPGAPMSVSKRDDIVRLAYASLGGERLRTAVQTFIRVALASEPGDPMV